MTNCFKEVKRGKRNACIFYIKEASGYNSPIEYRNVPGGSIPYRTHL